MVVKPMCSEICPCDPDMFAAWKATKPALQGTNRSWTQNSSQRAAQNKNGIGAGTVLLQAAKKGEKSYKDFMTCYNEVLSTKPADAKNNGEKMKAWFKENGAEGLAKMEKEMDCSGACKTPLFYVTRPFNEQPELVCTKAFVKKIGSAARTAGIVSIITALVSFCAFCGSFPLCTAFNDEEGEGAKSAER